MGKARRAAKKTLPGTAAAHAGVSRPSPAAAAAWPDVSSSFGRNTAAFGSPTSGSAKPFGGSVESTAGDKDARPLEAQTSDTIAPQNNYGDSEDGGRRSAAAPAAPVTHPRAQRRSSTPLMQPEGQNLKPGGSSAGSIPVVLQQQFDDIDDDDEEEKHEREETMQDAYFDELNDADEYKTYDDDEMEDDEDEYDDEYAARRSRRTRRRSRDGDRYRHGSYDAQQEDESYSDCGDDDQEQNLMDLLNGGISKSGSEADVAFNDSDSSNLDASIAVHNLASALPPPPPPSSSSQQGQPKQPGAASDPVADSANAFGMSPRWSQFEDDDQLQQMTLEANTAAVMMQMEKHMAKKEAGGGGHHSHGDQGQNMGWMEKARSVVAKIDEVKEREHLAAAAEEQQDERGEFQRRTSLKLGDDDDDTEESPKYRTAEGETYHDVGDVPVGREVSLGVCREYFNALEVYVYHFLYQLRVFAYPHCKLSLSFVHSSLPLCATMIRISLRPREGLRMTAVGIAEVIRAGPPAEGMEVVRYQEGRSLMTRRREDTSQFIRITLRPRLKMMKRQLGRRVFSPTATVSTAESVKVGVLLPSPLGGLVALASVPLAVVLQVTLEEEGERRSGMSQLLVPILYALISWTTTMTRVPWCVDRQCQLAMLTA